MEEYTWECFYCGAKLEQGRSFCNKSCETKLYREMEDKLEESD